MADKTRFYSLNRRRFLQTAGAAGSILVLGSAFPLRTRAAGPPAIKLGMIAPFTGSAAEFGPFYKDAATLAVQQVNNAAKQVFGGPIIADFIVEDSNTLPTPAIEAARKLVEADGVPAVLCEWSSGVTVAVASSVTIPAGVLQVGYGTTSPLVSVLPEDSEADLLFRTTASDALQGVVAAQLANGEIMPDYKFKTASTIFVNNPYGQGLSNAFTKAFEERGGKVLAQVPHPEEVQPTYKSQLSAALKDEPELLMCISYPAHTALYVKECRDVFSYTSWQFVDGNKSEEVLQAVGAADLEGKLGTAPGEDTNAPAYQGFAAAYQHDRIPPFTASAYDAGIVVGLALAKTIADGITDPAEITGTALRDRLRDIANPPGEKVDGGSQEGITKALELIKSGQNIDYTGAAGPADFDKNGDVLVPIEIWKFTADGTETLQLQPADQIPTG